MGKVNFFIKFGEISKSYFNFFVFNRIELPTTITSEKAIANAATIGFKKQSAAIGIVIRFRERPVFDVLLVYDAVLK